MEACLAQYLALDNNSCNGVLVTNRIVIVFVFL